MFNSPSKTAFRYAAHSASHILIHCASDLCLPPQSLDLDLTPESPDSIIMTGLGRPGEAGLAPFVQYATHPTHGSGPGELPAELQAFAVGNTGHPGFVQNQAPHSILGHFMADPTSPWTPWAVGTGSVSGVPARGQPAGIFFTAFGTFRNVAPPSEADTVNQSVGAILSDSGYGSMARQSVGNPSVYDGEMDQSVETQSLISRFRDLAPPHIASNEGTRKRIARQKSLPNTNILTCPDCKVSVKTNSELK